MNKIFDQFRLIKLGLLLETAANFIARTWLLIGWGEAPSLVGQILILEPEVTGPRGKRFNVG
ncbi:MAG: hypothetical protein WBG94_13860 [Anaerolineales bacterium]